VRPRRCEKPIVFLGALGGLVFSFVLFSSGEVMTKRFKKFLWTSNFWALIGFIGCGSGLYFQKMAQNGMGLWLLGLIFLGAAYVERAP
jgi:hypothetical protein